MKIEERRGIKIGVEVGGTFTDLVSVVGDEVIIRKTPSTPAQPDIGAFAVIEEAGLNLCKVTELVHGSTIATNAVLERKGARIAFVTTSGFRDLLFLQRHDRTSIYDIGYAKPQAVASREDCFEVHERILSDGTIIESLDVDDVRTCILPLLVKGGYGAVAVCLLGAFANPRHEEQLGRLISEALPDAFVALSSQINPEFREYERASTTALSAYVQPVISAYLSRFLETLSKAGFNGRFSVMQSNGGRLPAAAMRSNAITALFSGPAAGVIGATRRAALSGIDNIIALDMGGTSTDVCLVTGGKPALQSETSIDGLPVRTPIIDIVTVGAGGGSIGRIDEGGMLQVGPESAGAQPGPASYGQGGVRPTLTDAYVVLGVMRPEAFLGGTGKLDLEAARRVFEKLAEQLGTSVTRAAENVIRLAQANIVRAIQLISTERGRDPRDYTLVAYGGAGPLVASAVGQELGIDTVMIPPNPGVLSAYGLLASDIARSYGRTWRAIVGTETPAALASAVQELKDKASEDFSKFEIEGPREFFLSCDMRYVGQAFEVSVDLDPSSLDQLTGDELKQKFNEEHHRLYFHSSPEREVEVVSIRVRLTSPNRSVPPLRESPIERTSDTANVFVGDEVVAHTLRSAWEIEGTPISGPALVEGYTSTTLVPSGWTAVRDEAGNLLLRVNS